MQQIMIAIVGLTIYILFGYQVSPTCFENDDRIIIFKEPIPNKAMHGHMISRSEVPSEGSCRVNCYLDPNCVSINMGPFKEGNLMCELNNVTSSQKESFLREKKAHTYLEIENPCSSNPCLKDCACQAGFTSRGFRCQCGLFEELGCFQDVPKNRVFKNLLVSFRGNIDWKNMWKVVQDCSEEARKEGMYYFAIQYYGECYGGPNGTKYDKYGPSENCLSSLGVGGESANFVYRNTDL